MEQAGSVRRDGSGAGAVQQCLWHQQEGMEEMQLGCLHLCMAEG